MLFPIIPQVMLPFKIPGGRNNAAMLQPVLFEGRFFRCRLSPCVNQQCFSGIASLHREYSSCPGSVRRNNRNHIRRTHFTVCFHSVHLVPFPDQRRTIHFFYNPPQLRRFFCPVPVAHTKYPFLVIRFILLFDPSPEKLSDAVFLCGIRSSILFRRISRTVFEPSIYSGAGSPASSISE